ncbi:MAG: CDP-alcohol phosphatidyltransferase family protein [Deltaproteobacteria bacterium]|nr:CDP-alcohol phosphatidyltransferase family protein [Deltaproteobacteria bacterium]
MDFPWITLAPVVVINTILAISLLYFLATRKGRPLPEVLQTRNTSRLLNLTLKHWWYWNVMPLAKLCLRLGLTPNVLTFFGFLTSILAAWLFAKGLFGFAGWVMLFSSTFDLIDGYVARLTGKASKSGAFFDSIMDRFSEGAIFLGLAFYFRDSWILAFVIAGLIGSMTVSYARARGEAVGVLCTKGSMQRPERVVYIGCSSIFEPMTSYLLQLWTGLVHPPYLVIGAVLLIGVMTIATSVYRMNYVMSELDRQ